MVRRVPGMPSRKSESITTRSASAATVAPSSDRASDVTPAAKGGAPFNWLPSDRSTECGSAAYPSYKASALYADTREATGAPSRSLRTKANEVRIHCETNCGSGGAGSAAQPTRRSVATVRPSAYRPRVIGRLRSIRNEVAYGDRLGPVGEPR